MKFEIHEAKRVGARLLIQLSGVSGSGKTYSALQLAYGLAGNDASKIIGIDTENRRMSLNADCLPGGARFRVCEFYAPFSPARYIEAIDACVKAGAEVIVIDSVTHEWESEGGCEWIAHSANSRIPDWKRAKAEHKRFMTYMLQSPAHIICCTRAREKTDFTDPKNPKSLGLQPIQEKNFSYEATVSLMMLDSGRNQEVLKCPADLVKILGRGKGYLTAADGVALRKWVDGAEPLDQQVERAKGILQNASAGGTAALDKSIASVPEPIKLLLPDGFMASVRSCAQAYDADRRAATAESEQPIKAPPTYQIQDTLQKIASMTTPTALTNARRRADALLADETIDASIHDQIVQAIDDRAAEISTAEQS
jgi:hypothetical protein